MNASRVFLGLAIAALITSSASATVLRVNDESTASTPDGSNWTSEAYPFLQDALDDAQSGDQIWVKEGTYYPDDGDSVTSGSRTESFALKNGVAIYGGFDGDETYLSERPPPSQASPSTLNGDIDHDSQLDAGNSYHVVDGFGTDSTAVLDQFTITMGYAIGDADPPTGRSPNGGGFVVVDEIEEDPFAGHGSPTIRWCTFTENKAERGGAAYNFQGDTTFEDCTFDSNVATLHSGAVYTNGGYTATPQRGDATFVRCVFIDNEALDDDAQYTGGGAVHAGNCAPWFESCIFLGNRAGATGGNANARGGAIYSTCTQSPLPDASGATDGTTIVNCLFEDNQASIEGGAVFLDCPPPPQGSNEVIVDNCTFVKNKAEDSTNTTYGGGLTQDLGTGTITNCIFWGNTDSGTDVEEAQIYDKPSAGTADVSYTDIDCGTAGLDEYSGNNNIDDDPEFVGYATGNYRLDDTSPCRDEGDDSEVPAGVTTDLDGNSRIVNDDVDMGSYEYLATIDDAESCADHGGTEYCLDITGGNNIECRIEGATEFEVNLDLTVSSASASASCVNNTYSATPTVTVDQGDSSIIRVTFDPPLPDEDCCRVDLSGPSTDHYYVAILIGDVNRDGMVSTPDYSSVKARLGDPVDSGNFQYDVNTDGQISTPDASSVKARLENMSPDCP